MGDGSENYSSDEEEKNELPQIPSLNLAGPQEVNVDNSQVKIGNTVNVNLSVGNIVMKSERPDQLLQVCSTNLPGLLTNLLISQANTYKILNQCSADVFPLPIIHGEHQSIASSNVQNVALISCSTNDDTHSPNSAKVNSHEDVKKSHTTSHVENNQLEDIAFSATESDLPLNNTHCLKEDFDLSNSLGFTEHSDKDEVTVDSLINEFVKGVNDYLYFTGNNEIDVPSISGDIDILNMSSDTGKVKGLYPLIREEGIEIDLNDNLFVVSIPIKLELLILIFENFSLGSNGISMRGTLRITIVENSILINLSSGINANGYSENDVSVEINIQRFEIDFDSNFVANEILVRLVKKKN